MSSREHWNRVYETKETTAVSWFRPHLDRSLEFLELTNLSKQAAILDVGGGASTLVDDLLARGYSNISVLDISEAALQAAQSRLGNAASRVRWIVADVTQVNLPLEKFDLWHDRAVFHFLLDPIARAKYVETVRRTVKPGGHVIVATFGPHGPSKCSGLDVLRYDADGIHGEFGPEFTKVTDTTEIHTTPWGSEQEFVYCYCRVGV
jgi:ubiquinone/menaquinone biosynthesis C-methylase UbiE